MKEPGHPFEGRDGSGADRSTGVTHATLPGVKHLPQKLPGINLVPLMVICGPVLRR